MAPRPAEAGRAQHTEQVLRGEAVGAGGAGDEADARGEDQGEQRAEEQPLGLTAPLTAFVAAPNTAPTTTPVRASPTKARGLVVGPG